VKAARGIIREPSLYLSSALSVPCSRILEVLLSRDAYLRPGNYCTVRVTVPVAVVLPEVPITVMV
jgi:hypothetical protein